MWYCGRAKATKGLKGLWGFGPSNRKESGANAMSKILQSLPLTIVAGVVLTIIMAFATDAIVSSQGNYSRSLDQASDAYTDMTE